MASQIDQIVAEEEIEKPYDASDPEAVNLARKKAGRRKASRLEVVKALMDIPAGRKWLYEILSARCHVFTTSFVPGSTDISAFRAGEQHVGQQLLADIMEAAPDQYMTMCKEGAQNNT